MSAKDEWEARWENVQQLITFATDVGQAEGQSSATTEPQPEDLELSVNSKSPLSTTIVAKKQDHEVIDLTLDDDEDNAADGGEQEQGEEDLTMGYEHLASILEKPVLTLAPTRSTYPLRQFLEASMLSTDAQSAEAENNEPVSSSSVS